MLLHLRKNPSLRVVVITATVFLVLGLIFTLHRHFSFYSSYDQGIFNQVFWNNYHGRFFQSSLSSALSTNSVHAGEVPEVYYHRLGQHFTPALLVWWPIYALFPNPATLSVLLVTIVTAGGLVLYALARQHLEPPMAAKITVSYYAANAVIGPSLGNFHDICQIPLYVFTLLLAMEKRWWWLFWLMVPVTLAVREDAGITLFGVGVYMVLSRRFPRAGLALCVVSFGYIVALTNLIMPLFSEDISRRFMMERFGQYAEGEEASTVEILWGIVSNPFRFVVELVTPFFPTVKYLVGHWLPLAFVPAVSGPAWMIAGFPLLKLFLSQGESSLSINIRYAMSVIPGLFYGAILWWSQHQDVFKKRSFQKFWTACLCVSLFFSVVSSPNRVFYFAIPDSFQPWVYVSLPRQWQQVATIRSFMNQIPSDASVAATTFIIPHLSGRREILRFPSLSLRNDKREVIRMDYVLADLWNLQQYQVAFKNDRERIRNIVPVIDEVTANGEYGIVGFKDGVIFMRRGMASQPEAVQGWLAFRKQLEPILR